MKNKLWVFGDSFSTPFDKHFNQANGYVEWKGYIPPIYSNIISKWYGLGLQSRANVGMDNYSIMEKVCRELKNIKDGDIVIIGWSTPLRYRLVGKNGKFAPVIPNGYDSTDYMFDNISDKTVEETLINRLDYYKQYDYEIFLWSSLINRAIPPNTKILHWKWENSYNGDMLHYQSIYEETNGEINDSHYSEKGQEDLSKDFIKLLESKDKHHYFGSFTKELFTLI